MAFYRVPRVTPALTYCILNSTEEIQFHIISRYKDGTDSLTHWGRATYICVSKLTIIASDNGLSPGRRQVIIWNNAGILLIGLLGTNFSDILIEVLTFSFNKMHLKVSSAKCRTFCLGLNVLKLPLIKVTTRLTYTINTMTSRIYT